MALPRVASEGDGGVDMNVELKDQAMYKTELCKSFQTTGSCRYGGRCQFAHGHDELRPVLRHPKYKTEVCRTYASSGHCPYGVRCRFLHGNKDVEVAPNSVILPRGASWSGVSLAHGSSLLGAASPLSPASPNLSPATLSSSEDSPTSSPRNAEIPRRLPVFAGLTSDDDESGSSLPGHNSDSSASAADVASARKSRRKSRSRNNNNNLSTRRRSHKNRDKKDPAEDSCDANKRSGLNGSRSARATHAGPVSSPATPPSPDRIPRSRSAVIHHR